MSYPSIIRCLTLPDLLHLLKVGLFATALRANRTTNIMSTVTSLLQNTFSNKNVSVAKM